MNDKLTNKDIYVKTIGFAKRRFVLYLRGFILSIIIILAFGTIDNLLSFVFNYESSFIITWIGIGLGIFAFFFIAIMPIEPLRAAHTAIMTEAILHNNIPQPCVEEGQKIALGSFPVMSFLILFGEGFKALGDLISIRDASKRSDWGPKVKSMVLFLASGLIPYVGPCITSWAFCHQDGDTKDRLIEGTRLFFKNLRHLLWFMILNLIVLSAASVVGIIGLFNLIHSLFSRSQLLSRVGEILLASSDKYQGLVPAEAAVIAIVSILMVYVIWVFVRPMCTIPTLRRFYDSMSDVIKEDLMK